MSPKPGGRAQRRHRRNLLISVLVVVAISIGIIRRDRRRQLVAPPGPGPGRRRVGRLHGEGDHVTQSDLDETVNILNLRVNGLGVSGAQVQIDRDQADLGLHPGCHQRAAGAQARSARRRACTSARSSASPIPRRSRKASKTKLPQTGIETIPACQSSTQLTADEPGCDAQQLAPGLRLEQRAAGPDL